jgi:hypothetical protein
MNWKKLGKIFDPSEHTLYNNCSLYAQSPQTLVFNDFVRIYFSTRQIDADGKHLSFIMYVDFSKDFKTILKISNHEIIKLGNLGCYDEHGIFPLNIVRNKDLIYGFIGGWNRRYSVLVDGAIGLAMSKDNGETFQRIGDGPVMGPNLKEPFLVADPFVKIFDNIFHMWYIFGERWVEHTKGSPPERIYKIAHATSKDGINWDRNGKFIIPDSLSEEESQALPTVVKIGNIYHMYFCYRYAVDFRTNVSRGYKIGYAYSSDLINWTRNDKQAGIKLSEENAWDSTMMCYPHIFESDNKIFMLYNGNDFGKTGFGIAELIS